jgi:putative PIN family toxin of toxin-antitoxin system
MKVLIDTNIVVSAILKDRVPEKVILFVSRQGEFQWMVSEEILQEYLSVIKRPKFSLSQETQDKWTTMFARYTETVDVDTEIDFPRDRKDAKFLAAAISCDADFLITGDRDFEEAQKLLNTKIVSVSQFNRLICDTSTDAI